MPRSLPTALALLLTVALGACDEEEDTLVVTLVPNPEVNTRADVAEHVNRLDLVLDAQLGFANLDAVGDSWGPYEVTDIDGDGVSELLLSRRPNAFEPFAFAQGNQGDRVIAITARGMGTNSQLTALGGAVSAFAEGQQTEVEVPFNLVPGYRPLRVLSMTPASGARNLEPPIDTIALQLGGEVLDTAVTGNIVLSGEGGELEPLVTLSYVDTGMGRLTTIRLLECELRGGTYSLTLSTAVCSTTGRCLDQHLAVDGQQPFEGSFTVRGPATPPDCNGPEVESVTCPAVPCDEGFECRDGVCVLESISLPEGPATGDCDPTLCTAPEYVCDGQNICVPDCRLYGACPDLRDRCDAERGLCLHPDE